MENSAIVLKCVICSKDHYLKDCPVKLCEWCSTPCSKTHKQDHCYLAKCTRCLKQGHSINVCKSNNPVVCNFCKEEGHRSYDGTCPAIQKLVCKKCKATGHSTNRCPEKHCTFCTSSWNENAVLEFGETAPHNTVDCPVLEIAMCGRCGYTGHTTNHCKKINRKRAIIVPMN